MDVYSALFTAERTFRKTNKLGSACFFFSFLSLFFAVTTYDNDIILLFQRQYFNNNIFSRRTRVIPLYTAPYGAAAVLVFGTHVSRKCDRRRSVQFPPPGNCHLSLFRVRPYYYYYTTRAVRPPRIYNIRMTIRLVKRQTVGLAALRLVR